MVSLSNHWWLFILKSDALFHRFPSHSLLLPIPALHQSSAGQPRTRSADVAGFQILETIDPSVFPQFLQVQTWIIDDAAAFAAFAFGLCVINDVSRWQCCPRCDIAVILK